MLGPKQPEATPGNVGFIDVPKIIKAFPPNWPALAKVFPIKGRPQIVYAWGDLIFNPSGVALPPWVLAHEGVHGERQKVMGISGWWDTYCMDPDFRLNEEILAHRVEWGTYAGPKREHYLKVMAKRLSSPLYGSLVTEAEAVDLICNVSYPNYRDE
jgi:hypothetical protein